MYKEILNIDKNIIDKIYTEIDKKIDNLTEVVEETNDVLKCFYEYEFGAVNLRFIGGGSLL